MITKESQEALHLFSFYRNKQLALSGGVLDQPAKYLDAMQAIERHLNSER